jgi:hypothetical protein
MGRLGNDRHIDEVVEELEEADATVDDLAVRSGRAPEPRLEAAPNVIGHGRQCSDLNDVEIGRSAPFYG